MIHDLRRRLIVVAGVVLFATSASVVSAQNPNVVVGKLDKMYKALVSMKGRIKMDKYDPNLDDHDISEGMITLLLQANKRPVRFARIDWEKPRAENLAINGDKYTIFRPSMKQAMTGSASKSQKGVPGGVMDVLNLSREKIKANYEPPQIAGEETIEGGVKASHLILTPKVKASFTKADIWVDQDGVIRLAKITEKGGQTTSVLLSGVDLNGKIDAKAFDIKLPPGTKVIPQ